jgi:drug/metabolite transporter (DMT)-like permease
LVPEPAKINAAMNCLEWALLVVLSMLWGGSFFFNAIAVKELPTFTVVFSRVALAAAILFLAMSLSGQRISMNRQAWRAFLVIAMLNSVMPFSLIVWAQSHIASAVAAILNATTPLFTVIVAQLYTNDEKLSSERVFSVLVGLMGVATMVGADARASLGADLGAQLACLGAAICYALAGVYGRRFRILGISPMEAAAGQVVASSILLVPVVLIVDPPWTLPVPSTAAVSSLIGLAALSTALAYTLYFRILATAGATNLLLVTFLVPVSAILLGILVLHEVLSSEQLIGMTLIGCGLAAIDGRTWTFLERKIAVRSGKANGNTARHG